MQITHSTWMNQSVMVLNAAYEAMTYVPAARAIAILQQRDSKNRPMATAMKNHDSGFTVRSQHLTVPLPEIIVLSKYVYIEHNVEVHEHSQASAPAILRRDKNQCGYCNDLAFTIDHIIPQSRGGADTWSNLIAACSSCNARKADMTPEEAGMPLLWPPKVPRWDEKRQRQIWRSIILDDVEMSA